MTFRTTFLSADHRPRRVWLPASAIISNCSFLGGVPQIIGEAPLSNQLIGERKIVSAFSPYGTDNAGQLFVRVT
jgi:hypothetical protein